MDFQEKKEVCPDVGNQEGQCSLATVVRCFLVAVIVAITMAAQRNSLSAEVTELQQQIAEEQATWQAIAAEKEELQATLTETENALKEAQLSLEEATARKAELETEVEELTASNEAATQEIAGLPPRRKLPRRN